MNKYGKGFIAMSPDKSITTERLLGMFVDDTCQMCNSYTEPLLQQTAVNLQEHSDVVYVTGGLLALFKCAYYFVNFEFDDDGEHSIIPMDRNQHDLKVHMIDSETLVTIDQLDPNDPHKNLGCHLSPTGNQHQTYKQLLEASTAWANSVLGSALTPQDIVQSYHCNLLPGIIYRLAAASLSPTQCDLIMKPIFTPLLNVYGVPRTISRTLVHVSPQYAGMSLKHIYDLNGIEKLKFLMLHL